MAHLVLLLAPDRRTSTHLLNFDVSYLLQNPSSCIVQAYRVASLTWSSAGACMVCLWSAQPHFDSSIEKGFRTGTTIGIYKGKSRERGGRGRSATNRKAKSKAEAYYEDGNKARATA